MRKFFGHSKKKGKSGNSFIVLAGLLLRKLRKIIEFLLLSLLINIKIAQHLFFIFEFIFEKNNKKYFISLNEYEIFNHTIFDVLKHKPPP
jgi:hypothetical protein